MILLQPFFRNAVASALQQRRREFARRKNVQDARGFSFLVQQRDDARRFLLLQIRDQIAERTRLNVFVFDRDGRVGPSKAQEDRVRRRSRNSLLNVLQLRLVQSQALSDAQISGSVLVLHQAVNDVLVTVSQVELGREKRALKDQRALPAGLASLGDFREAPGRGQAVVAAVRVRVQAVALR